MKTRTHVVGIVIDDSSDDFATDAAARLQKDLNAKCSIIEKDGGRILSISTQTIINQRGSMGDVYEEHGVLGIISYETSK